LTKPLNSANINLEKLQNKYDFKDLSMTMAFGAEQLRKSDDPKDQEIANLLEAALALRGKDIPLPGHEAESTVDEPRTELGKIAVEHVVADDQLPAATELPTTARFATPETPIIGLSIEAPEKMGQLAAEVQNLSEVQAVIIAARAKAVYHPDEKEKRAQLRGDKDIEWEITQVVPGKQDMYYENYLAFEAETKEPKLLKVDVRKENIRNYIIVVHYADQGLSAISASFYDDVSSVGLEQDIQRSRIKGDRPFLNVDQFPMYQLSIAINVEVGKLSVTVKSRDYKGPTVDRYIYNPDRDIFEGRRNDTASLRSASVEDFKDLIRRTLNLIPIEINSV
jgi:hypothetical protein